MMYEFILIVPSKIGMSYVWDPDGYILQTKGVIQYGYNFQILDTHLGIFILESPPGTPV